MLNEYFWQLLLALVAVIIFLIITAFKLNKSLKEVENEKKRVSEEFKNREKERKIFVNESLVTIAKAMLEGQCEISEGCLRIRMLIERTGDVDFSKNEYRSFYEVYEKIKHLKIKEERANLSKSERRDEDFLRMRIEDDYRELVLNSSKVLIQDLRSF